MTRTEYNGFLETEAGREYVEDYFGTSGVYKNDISFETFKNVDIGEIVYIPENGWEYFDNGKLNVEELDVYTIQDLVDMFNGNVEDAYIFFDTLGWSFPSTLFDEEYNNGEIKYCSKCDKFFYDYWNKECKICGTRYDNADNDY